jgi:hypothetical protein
MGDAVVKVKPLGDNRCRITTAEDTLPWLAFRLLQLDVDFEVQNPPEMRAYLDRLRTRLPGAPAHRP